MWNMVDGIQGCNLCLGTSLPPTPHAHTHTHYVYLFDFARTEHHNFQFTQTLCAIQTHLFANIWIKTHEKRTRPTSQPPPPHTHLSVLWWSDGYILIYTKLSQSLYWYRYTNVSQSMLLHSIITDAARTPQSHLFVSHFCHIFPDNRPILGSVKQTNTQAMTPNGSTQRKTTHSVCDAGWWFGGGGVELWRLRVNSFAYALLLLLLIWLRTRKNQQRGSSGKKQRVYSARGMADVGREGGSFLK